MRTTPAFALTAIVGVLLLAGCAGGAQPGGAAPEPIDTDAVFEPVAFPEPDIGPWPETPAPSDTEREALRLAEQDASWERVVTYNPEAVRPADPFERYLADDREWQPVAACLDEMGVPYTLSTFENGEVAGAAVSSMDDELHAVGEFTCRARFAPEPYLPPTDDQKGWLYDRWAQFVVPCYEANGLEQSEGVSREEWIATWPNHAWHLDVSSVDWDTADRISAACPVGP